MVARHSSLTGAWSGAYRYPGGHETVFNAQITEQAGAFVGITQEPNEIVDDTVRVLHGDIEGHREGSAVTFTKFYNHEDEETRHSIRYEGAANESLTHIEGRWIVASNWSGTFFMDRDDHGEEAEAEERAEQPVSDRT